MRRALCLLFLAALFGGCRSGSEDETALRPVDADALLADLEALDARVVVLNVWATWCAPCRREFPDYVRYQREVEGEGIAVRFLSVDALDVHDRVQTFLQEHGAGGPHYVSSSGESDIVEAIAYARGALWSHGIPVTFVFDGEGELKDFWEGAANYDLLRQRIDAVLAAPPAGSAAAR